MDERRGRALSPWVAVGPGLTAVSAVALGLTGALLVLHRRGGAGNS